MFDYDNTLYDSRCGLMDEVARRMALFLQEKLNLSPEHAKETAHHYRRTYGTVTTGLFKERPEVDLELFNQFVHDFSLPDYLSRDQRLQEILGKSKIPHYVLSNGWEEYVEEGLRLLGIRDYFRNVFGIRFAHFVGKPNPSAYERVLDEISVTPEQVVYFDDNPHDLKGAKELGMTTVWVHRNKKTDLPAWVDHHLESIYQLAEAKFSC